MTQTTVTFNENEVKVLKSLANEMNDCTGGEFGYIQDADRGDFTKHEFAGYIGCLQQKGCFDYIDTMSKEVYKGQFSLKEDMYNQYK